MLKDCYTFDWSPKWAVSDAADAISNSLKNVFPQTEHVRCFFHTVKAVRDKINRWKNTQEKKSLKDKWRLLVYSLKLLHRTQSDEDFLA